MPCHSKKEPLKGIVDCIDYLLWRARRLCFSHNKEIRYEERISSSLNKLDPNWNVVLQGPLCNKALLRGQEKTAKSRCTRSRLALTRIRLSDIFSHKTESRSHRSCIVDSDFPDTKYELLSFGVFWPASRVQWCTVGLCGLYGLRKFTFVFRADSNKQ